MAADAVTPSPLAGTSPLTLTGDPATRMVEGLHAFVDRELDAADRQRQSNAHLAGDAASWTALAARQRERLARLLGVVDPRLPVPALELLASTAAPDPVARAEGYTVYAVRWPVLDGVDGEGLLLRPHATPRAHVVALPDADWSPEQLAGLAPGVPPPAQFVRRLAERGCAVVVPALINRRDTWSGNPEVRMTNQPHREYVYRMAFELGRHVIGYEVQKVLALVDFFTGQGSARGVPVGVCGYGEGGLLALYTGALDQRIAVTVVSGHFRHRRQVWQEPIYRDVWRLLQPTPDWPDFGDAELASLIAPRALVVEAAPGPVVDGPPESRQGRSGAAPGVLHPAPLAEVRAEVALARRTFERLAAADRLVLIEPAEGVGGLDTDAALDAFLGLLAGRTAPAAVSVGQAAGGALDVDSGAAAHQSTGQTAEAAPRAQVSAALDAAPPGSADAGSAVERAEGRQRRQFEQLCRFTQTLLHRSAKQRDHFWSAADTTSLEMWQRSTARYRDYFWDEVLGRCPPPSLPANPRTRQVYDRPGWTGYEVTLDLWPDVFAYGMLLVPKGMKPGERRPVVVCQHGLEGRPPDTIDKPESPYRDFAARLADRGYVVYAPQNPYVGGDSFRSLVRKAHLLGWTIYSFILSQHDVTLSWLAGLDFVDGERIAFYGLSYGGKTAMRIPALLERYALSICSGDFNEWIAKCASTEMPVSYMFTGEYEMFEFDLGHTFNYAEMANLIAPRPFMVERGHRDGVGLDEWVAFEFAKVRRRYADLHIPERTEIAFFDGGHMIDGRGTFPFLDRHMRWTPAAD